MKYHLGQRQRVQVVADALGWVTMSEDGLFRAHDRFVSLHYSYLNGLLVEVSYLAWNDNASTSIYPAHGEPVEAFLKRVDRVLKDMAERDATRELAEVLG